MRGRREGGRGWPREACPSVSSTAFVLYLPLLPRKALYSLVVAHFWPPTQGTLVFLKEGPNHGIGPEEQMS